MEDADGGDRDAFARESPFSGERERRRGVLSGGDVAAESESSDATELDVRRSLGPRWCRRILASFSRPRASRGDGAGREGTYSLLGGWGDASPSAARRLRGLEGAAFAARNAPVSTVNTLPGGGRRLQVSSGLVVAMVLMRGRRATRAASTSISEVLLLTVESRGRLAPPRCPPGFGGLCRGITWSSSPSRSPSPPSSSSSSSSSSPPVLDHDDPSSSSSFSSSPSPSSPPSSSAFPFPPVSFSESEAPLSLRSTDARRPASRSDPGSRCW